MVQQAHTVSLLSPRPTFSPSSDHDTTVAIVIFLTIAHKRRNGASLTLLRVKIEMEIKIGITIGMQNTQSKVTQTRLLIHINLAGR